MLKDQIKIVYQKHVHDDVSEAANVDQDIQKEYARQRDHLEKTVNSLKYKLSKDSEIHKNDNIRIMQVMKIQWNKLSKCEHVLNCNLKNNQRKTLR